VATTSDRVGHVINQRYEILSVIGRGGQGLVYRCFDRWNERAVAMKVLSSKAAREPQMAERLVREQQALSALKGTSAVELYDVCRGNDGELCLVMELLVGMDLDDYLYSIEQRNQRIELLRVAEIFDPIVDTLEVAHNAGILHRDLKPANVFLLEGGGVRLLDFGMARLKKAAPLTAAGTIMGSPSFMAPEAWKGQSELVDHRADVYSLGVILFRVLAGDLPFAGESLHEKFLGSTKGARPSLIAKRPDLPRDADEWVVMALAIDREERFGNVRALWNAFLTTFHVQPPGKRGPSLWAAAKGAVKRLAGGSDKPPPAQQPTQRTSEPSFGREALARSVMQRDPTPSPGARPAPAPAPQPSRAPSKGTRAPAPPRPRSAPPPEATIELTDVDLSQFAPPPPRPKPVEKTLELDAAELVVTEATLPDAAPAPGARPPTNAPPKPPPQRRRERSSISRKRGKR
jgi:eukaryotic-like serine/threonine-protein kinase